MNDRLIDWLIDWVTDYLIACLIHSHFTEWWKGRNCSPPPSPSILPSIPGVEWWTIPTRWWWWWWWHCTQHQYTGTTSTHRPSGHLPLIRTGNIQHKWKPTNSWTRACRLIWGQYSPMYMCVCHNNAHSVQYCYLFLQSASILQYLYFPPWLIVINIIHSYVLHLCATFVIGSGLCFGGGVL